MGGGRDDAGDTWTGEEPVPDAVPEADLPSRYVASGTIGKGAIGVVRSVYDNTLGRTVAYKSLKDQKNTSMASRFLREARITAQLEHPSIVAVHDLGTEPDGTRFYTMRYVKGDTLEKRFKACKTLAERLALLGHFVDLCQAIGFAHSKGVIHRDLKPANVMVGEHGETQLLDWGLAKEKGEVHERDEDISRISRAVPQAKDSGATVMGTVLGTPSYMSPEQASGDVASIDARSDVWSLGVMLFELLSGKRPFDGTDPWDVIARVRRNEHPRLVDLEGMAPPELVAITNRAMSVNPADRYPTGAEMAADVDAWMTGGRVAAFRYSLRDEATRFVRRWRAPLAVAAVLGAVLVVGSTAAFVQIVNQRDRAVQAEAVATWNLAELYAERAVERLEAGRNVEAALFAATSLVLRENPDARGVLLAANTRWPTLTASAAVACHDLVMSDKDRVYCATGSGLEQIDLATGSVRVVHDHPVTFVEPMPDGRFASFSSTGDAWYNDDAGVTEGEDLATVILVVTATRDGSLGWIAGPRIGFRGPGLPAYINSFETANALVYDPAWGWLGASGSRGILQLAPGAQELAALAWSEAYMVRGLAFEPAPEAKLVFGTAEGAVWVRGSDGALTSLPSHRGAIAELVYVTPGVIASVGEDSLLAFSSPDGRLLGRLGMPASSELARTDDGRLISYDPNDKAVRVWDVSGLGVAGNVAGVADEGLSTAGLAADGSLVTFHGSGTVRRYGPDGRLAAERTIGTTVIKAGVVGPDYIAAGLSSGGLFVLDAADLSVRFEVPDRGIIGMDATPDGMVLIATVRVVDDANKGGVVRIDPRTGSRRILHRGGVPKDVDVSADKFVFVGEDGTVVIDDLEGRELARLASDAREVAFLDDDHVLLSTETGTVSSWAWRTGAVTGPFLGATWHHGAPIDGLAVSRDGSLVATASWDRTVGLWDAKTGALRAVLRGHDHRVSDVTFAADGRYLVSASWDGLARRWDLAELDRAPAGIVDAVRDQVGFVVEDGRIVTHLPS